MREMPPADTQTDGKLGLSVLFGSSFRDLTRKARRPPRCAFSFSFYSFAFGSFKRTKMALVESFQEKLKALFQSSKERTDYDLPRNARALLHRLHRPGGGYLNSYYHQEARIPPALEKSIALIFGFGPPPEDLLVDNQQVWLKWTRDWASWRNGTTAEFIDQYLRHDLNPLPDDHWALARQLPELGRKPGLPAEWDGDSAARELNDEQIKLTVLDTAGRSGLAGDTAVIALCANALSGSKLTRRHAHYAILSAPPNRRDDFLKLMRNLRTHENPRIRGEAVYCLGIVPDSGLRRLSAAELCVALKDQNPFVRACATNISRHLVPFSNEILQCLQDLLLLDNPESSEYRADDAIYYAHLAIWANRTHRPGLSPGMLENAE